MTDSNLKAPSRLRSAIRQIGDFCRTRTRSILKWVAVFVVVVELGGIWNEVRHIRNEQVKNEWTALPSEVRQRIEQRSSTSKKQYESTSNANVQGSVSIEGDVDLREPVEVEIDR